MLGETIHDPHAIESSLGTVAGLGYLAMTTRLEKEKILKQQMGFLWDKSTPVTGYEIHCGQSKGDAILKPALYFSNGNSLMADGAISDDNQILGTYLHGLFDSEQACLMLLNWCGANSNTAFNINDLREKSLNTLAARVAEAMDIFGDKNPLSL
jgi:adenosylcobyric acid synthase